MVGGQEVDGRRESVCVVERIMIDVAWFSVSDFLENVRVLSPYQVVYESIP